MAETNQDEKKAMVAISGILGKMGQDLATMLEAAGYGVSGFDTAIQAMTPQDRIRNEGRPIFPPQELALRLSAPKRPEFFLIFNGDPEATARQAKTAALTGIKLVIGTTGLSFQQDAALRNLANQVAMVYSANFSPAVNLMLELAKQMRESLPGDYKCTILERHHVHKKDAPSGTARALARQADVGDEEVISIRAGEIVGDHTVTFTGSYDELEIAHRAQSRKLFCCGAVEAVKFLGRQSKPGMYTMPQVFGWE